MSKDNFVFVIDGDASARIGLKRLLIAAGHEVKVYSSTKEFLSSVDSRVSGCLVLDAGVSELSCQELIAEFIEREIKLSVIVISAEFDPETKKIAKEVKAVGFFRKPVDGQALIDAVDWALRSGKISYDRKKTFHDDS